MGVYLDYLRQRGHTYKVFYSIPNTLSRVWIGERSSFALFDSIASFWYTRLLKHLKLLWIIINAKRFDAILIQKVNLLCPLVRLLVSRNKNIVFDFDDQCFWDLEWVKNKNISLLRRIRFWRRGLQHPKVLKLFKQVIVGNRRLSELAIFVRGKENITIIPTPVDCVLYDNSKHNLPPAHPIAIGWAGSGENHLRHLELLEGPLRELAKRHDFTFKLIGAMYSEKIKGLFRFLDERFICIDWIQDYSQLIDAIKSFDIGVMPLRDDGESRFKCGFKALQYMASGIAVVVSPVGINKEIVQDGINGFWASDEKEWVKKLSILIEDKDLRKRFGLNSRKTVDESYNINKTFDEFASILENLN